MQDKEVYNQLCAQVEDLPIFYNKWWMDSLVGEENWSFVFHKGESITSFWPYYRKSKFGFKAAVMPPLTPYLNPIFIVSDKIKKDKIITIKKESIINLFQQLADLDFIQFQCFPDIYDHLVYHWVGFKNTMKYTYKIPDIKAQSLLDHISKNTRKHIRKASRKYRLTFSDDAPGFYEMHESLLHSKGKKPAISLENFLRLDKHLRANEARIIYLILDDQNKPITSLYSCRDNKNSYHLMSGRTPNIKDNDTYAYVFYSAIHSPVSAGLEVDFVGSMIPEVVEFEKGFNPIPLGYHKLYKTQSAILKYLSLFRTS